MKITSLQMPVGHCSVLLITCVIWSLLRSVGISAGKFLLSQLSRGQGSFRGGTRGNAIPIVEKLPERMGTAFPLLKCLRMHKTHLKLRKKNKNGLRLLPYAKPRVVDQLTLTKIIKIVANRWRILWLKCTNFDFGWGSAPDPRWGSLQRPQTP